MVISIYLPVSFAAAVVVILVGIMSCMCNKLRKEMNNNSRWFLSCGLATLMLPKNSTEVGNELQKNINKVIQLKIC